MFETFIFEGFESDSFWEVDPEPSQAPLLA